MWLHIGFFVNKCPFFACQLVSAALKWPKYKKKTQTKTVVGIVDFKMRSKYLNHISSNDMRIWAK